MHLSHHHFTTYLQCKLGSSRSAFSDRLPSPTKEPLAGEKWSKTVCLEADCLPNHPTCCLYESFLARCVITISTSQDHSAWVAQLQIDPDLPVHLNGRLNQYSEREGGPPQFFKRYAGRGWKNTCDHLEKVWDFFFDIFDQVWIPSLWTLLGLLSCIQLSGHVRDVMWECQNNF